MRNQLFKQAKHVFKASLYFAFKIWTRQEHRCCFSVVYGFVAPQDAHMYMFMHGMYRCVQSYLKRYLRLEWDAYIANMADEAHEQLVSGTPRGLHIAVKKVKPRKNIRPVLRLVNSNDLPCSTYNEERETFRAHFASLLHGSTSSMASLIDAERMSRDDHRLLYVEDSQSHFLGAVPSVVDLASDFAQSPKHKACPNVFI